MCSFPQACRVQLWFSITPLCYARRKASFANIIEQPQRRMPQGRWRPALQTVSERLVPADKAGVSPALRL